MRRMSVALGDLAKRAIEAFQDALTLKSPTTHDGLIKAMALKTARAMMAPERKPRGDHVANVLHNLPNKNGKPHHVFAPLFYLAPQIRLNRSRKWAPAASYAEARERTQAFRVARDFGLLA